MLFSKFNENYFYQINKLNLTSLLAIEMRFNANELPFELTITT